MKRCPACKSLSPDDEMTCGMCGASIGDVPFESMEEIERDEIADHKQEELAEHKELEKAKIRLVFRTAIGIVIGVGVTVSGIALILYENPLAIFVLLVGCAIIGAAFGLGPRAR